MALASAITCCTVHISREPVARVSECFLSVAVDIAQAVGGRFWGAEARRDLVPGGGRTVAAYDFDRPGLVQLVGALAPAYLRIGGTASDQVYYDLGDRPSPALPEGYRYRLTRTQWDAINRFAIACGLEVVFTLNAGRGPRGSGRAWTPDNAAALIAYTVGQGYPVAMWALGNEPNFFPFAHGLPIWAGQLAADYATLRRLLDDLAPDARLGGPSSPYWPVVGEMLPFLGSFLRRAGGLLDVVTWHYYPQQSRRSPVATRRASARHALSPRFLDTFADCARRVEAARNRHAPHAEIWLEETGNAQCGGEPGLSDRFIAGFWWLDQLGQAARRGHQVVIRQNLSGADYGLLDDASLTPNPDYWSSLLWRRLMGRAVFAAEAMESDPACRVFAHDTPDMPGLRTVLALNLSRERGLQLQFADGLAATAFYLVTADDLLGKAISINGSRPTVDAAGRPTLPPSLRPSEPVELPPASYAFVVLALDSKVVQ